MSLFDLICEKIPEGSEWKKTSKPMKPSGV